MPPTKREWSSPLVRHGLTAVALGLFLGFLGPFGTYPALERGERYAFWLGATLFGYASALAAWRLLAGSQRFETKNAALRVATAGLLSSVPQTFVAGWALTVVQPGRVIAPANLPLLFTTVAAVQLILVAVIAWLDQAKNHAAELEPIAVPLAGRIPAPLRVGLRALEAEDHYVRVHTASGSTLLLHRLSDAIAEVSALDGLQVHRGWWVAGNAVVGSYVRNGRRWLKLEGGLDVPVSRARNRQVLVRDWPKIPRESA